MKYIGKCKFSRINGWRDYLGSGLYLKRAINKYGKDNFKRTILFLATTDEELNEIEEFVIKHSNAVESTGYYNIKYSSVGGDIFTNNPRKEEIRKMRVEQMSGEGNHQYGKKKTKKMIESVIKANSKSIMVDGVIYKSITECHYETNIGISTIHYRLNSEGFPNYKYL